MPDLKPGWTRVKFGQLAECVNDRVDDPSSAGVERYVGLEHLDPESLTIRRWGTPEDVESTKLRFKPGDIIFGKRRAYQRKLAVPDFEGICSAHAMVLRAKHDLVLPEFLPYFMQSGLFMERAVKISVGSLSPTINWKTLAAQEFALPPLEEQRRIVALLLRMEEAARCVREGGEAAALLERALVYSEIERFSIRYPTQALSEVCLRVTDGTHQPPKFIQSGVPFFLVKTISGGAVDWSHTKFVSEDTYKDLTRRVRPKRGDVLYTAVGATYGVALHVDFDKPFVFQRHIAHIIPDASRVLGEYLESFLNSPAGKRQSDQNAIGSAQPTVTLGSLSRFKLPIPPLDEQQVLVERVRELRNGRRALTERSAAIGAARAAVLSELTL